MLKLYFDKFDNEQEPDWDLISKHFKLSEEFMRKYSDKLNWMNLCIYQFMSVNFMREFIIHLKFPFLAFYQVLDFEFLKDYAPRLKWNHVSRHQHLTEDMIRYFQHRVDWDNISTYQKLSEEFIIEYNEQVNWKYVSEYQALSEKFIEQYKNKLDLDLVIKSQKLSDNFFKKYNLTKPVNNWLYETVENKLKYIQENSKFKIQNDEKGDMYLIAYKTVKDDYSSIFNYGYKFIPGNIYNNHCNCDLTEDNSFGINLTTKQRSIDWYDNGRLLIVKVYIKDIGSFIPKTQKVRVFKVEIIGEENIHQ